MLRDALFSRRGPILPMRVTNLAFPLKPVERLLTSTSARDHIFMLTLIPVVRLLANGLTFVSSKREVGTAFETATHSTALADATRDFTSAVVAMQMIVKDFAANPSNNLVLNFGREHAQALWSLDIIAASIDRRRLRTRDRTNQRHHS